MRLASLLVLISGGKNAEFLLEVFAECLRAVEARAVSHLRDIELAFSQQLRSSFESDDAYEFYRRFPSDLLYFLVEFYAAHA